MKKLLAHQKTVIESFLTSDVEKKGLCIFHDTGTGKTFTTLNILDQLGVEEAIIVVPNMQVAREWENQSFSDIKFHFITYATIGKILLRDDLTQVKALVFDESHKLKSPRSDRTRLACMLVNKFRTCYRFLLSATPITLNELDFIPQLKIASGGKFFEGMSFYKIRKTYFINTAPPSVKWQRWSINPKLKPEFYAEVNKYSSFVGRHELSGLPIKHSSIITYNSSVKTLYTDLLVRKKDTPEVRELLRPYDSVNELTLLGVAHRVMISDPVRYEKLKLLLERHKDSKILIWSYYRDSYPKIEEVIHSLNLRLAGIVYGGLLQSQRTKAVEDFRGDNSPSVLVASIGTLSEGVNLQCAKVSIFFDLSYNYADIYQAEARNYRFGSPYQDVYEYFFRSDLNLDHVLYKNFKQKLSQDPKLIYKNLSNELTTTTK